VATASWNSIRARTNLFVNEWLGETKERAEKGTFWNEFLAIFGVSRRRVAVFELYAHRESTGRGGFMDLLWPGTIGVEHKSSGEDLDEAKSHLSTTCRDCQTKTCLALESYVTSTRFAYTTSTAEKLSPSHLSSCLNISSGSAFLPDTSTTARKPQRMSTSKQPSSLQGCTMR